MYNQEKKKNSEKLRQILKKIVKHSLKDSTTENIRHLKGKTL